MRKAGAKSPCPVLYGEMWLLSSDREPGDAYNIRTLLDDELMTHRDIYFEAGGS